MSENSIKGTSSSSSKGQKSEDKFDDIIKTFSKIFKELRNELAEARSDFINSHPNQVKILGHTIGADLNGNGVIDEGEVIKQPTITGAS